MPAGGGENTEVRIIESLADPKQRPLTIEQRCERLGISRSTWYRHMEDPLFRARATAAWRECCRDRLGEVMESLLNSAIIVGREGHQDRKLLLELLGEYTPGLKVEGEQRSDAGTRGALEDCSDEQLLLLFEGKVHLLPPGVQRRLGHEVPPPDEPESRKTRGGPEAAATSMAGAGGNPGRGS